jgi:putative membrane protein
MLPFSFVPLVIGTMYLAQKQTTTLKKILVSALLLLTVDFMLDPAAVALGLWIWDSPGTYYGIPLANFAGWIFSGIIASSIFLAYKLPPLKKESSYSLYLIISFWTGACLWMQLWIPLAIGLILLAVLLKEYQKSL